MQLTVNKKIYEFSEDVVTLSRLIELLAIDTLGVAFAVNNKVVANSVWNEYYLHSNDQVTIVRATAGG